MHASTSQKRPRWRSAWIAALGLAVLAGAIGLYLARSRGAEQGFAGGHAPAVVAQGSYRNRALIQRSDAPPPAAELPVIQGNVYDTEGNLLAGAVVLALTYDTSGNVASRAASVESDEQGRFEISLREGAYSLNVSRPGYGSTSVVAQTGDTVSAVLPKSGTLSGHVVDEKGRPVRRFTIDVISAVPGDAPAPPPLWSKTYDVADGAFSSDQLPAWPVVVRAASPSFAPGFSRPLQLRPGDSQELTITLTEGCPLRGTVVDRDGKPLAGVLVNAEERVTAGSMTDPVVQASTQAASAEDGSFALAHVPRGTVLLRGYDADHAPSSLTLDMKECDKAEPVRLVMSAGGSVEGTARSADGQPLAGARVTLTERSVGIVSTLTDEEGKYRFDELPPAILRIQLDHGQETALRFVQVREGATARLDLSLFAAGTGELRGRVLAGKAPIAGARLLVASNHGRAAGMAMYFPVTAADGTYRVPALPAGGYVVSVMSTSEGRGVEVKKDETATVDLDVSFVPGMGDPNAPAPRPHARRLREKRQQAAEEQAGEGATPTP